MRKKTFFFLFDFYSFLGLSLLLLLFYHKFNLEMGKRRKSILNDWVFSFRSFVQMMNQLFIFFVWNCWIRFNTPSTCINIKYLLSIQNLGSSWFDSFRSMIFVACCLFYCFTIMILENLFLNNNGNGEITEHKALVHWISFTWMNMVSKQSGENLKNLEISLFFHICEMKEIIDQNSPCFTVSNVSACVIELIPLAHWLGVVINFCFVVFYWIHIISYFNSSSSTIQKANFD